MTTPPAPKPAAGWPSAVPHLLREYVTASDFRRHAAQLARNGWHPLTVTRRAPSRVHRLMDAVSLGLFSLLTRTEPLLLVAYGPR